MASDNDNDDRVEQFANKVREQRQQMVKLQQQLRSLMQFKDEVIRSLAAVDTGLPQSTDPDALSHVTKILQSVVTQNTQTVARLEKELAVKEQLLATHTVFRPNNQNLESHVQKNECVSQSVDVEAYTQALQQLLEDKEAMMEEVNSKVLRLEALHRETHKQEIPSKWSIAEVQTQTASDSYALIASNNNNADLGIRLESALHQASVLKAENRELTGILQEKETQISELSSTLEHLQSALEPELQRVQQLGIELDNTRRELECMTQRNNELVLLLREKERRLQDMSSRASLLEERHKLALTNEMKAEEKRQQSWKREQELFAQLKSLTQAMQMQDQQLSELHQSTTTHSKGDDPLINMTHRIQELSMQLSEAEVAKVSVDAELSNMRAQVALRTRQITTLQSEVSSLRQRLGDSDMSQMNVTIESLQASLDHKEREVMELRQTIECGSLNVSNFQQELVSVKESFQHREDEWRRQEKSLLEEINKSKQEFDQLRNTLKDRISQLESQVTQASERESRLRSEMNILEKRNTRCEEELTEARQQIHSLKSKSDEDSQVTQQCEVLLKQLQTAESIAEHLHREQQRQDADINRLRKERDQLKQSRTQALEEVRLEWTNKMAQMSQTYQRAEEQLNERYRQQIQSLELEIQDLSIKLRSSEATTARLTEISSRERNRLTDLVQELQRRSEQVASLTNVLASAPIQPDQYSLTEVSTESEDLKQISKLEQLVHYMANRLRSLEDQIQQKNESNCSPQVTTTLSAFINEIQQHNRLLQSRLSPKKKQSAEDLICDGVALAHAFAQLIALIRYSQNKIESGLDTVKAMSIKPSNLQDICENLLAESVSYMTGFGKDLRRIKEATSWIICNCFEDNTILMQLVSPPTSPVTHASSSVQRKSASGPRPTSSPPPSPTRHSLGPNPSPTLREPIHIQPFVGCSHEDKSSRRRSTSVRSNTSQSSDSSSTRPRSMSLGTHNSKRPFR